jgi:Xaa-Pro dipeptidase
MASSRDPASRSPRTLDRRGLLTVGAAGLSAACAAGAPARPLAPASPRDELDELFADLVDRSGEWQPITVAEKAPRLARLGALLAAAGIDALVIEAGATLSYLCDVRWGRSERLFALVVLADGSCFWISPAFEAPRARRRIEEAGGPQGPVVTWDEHEYAWHPLAAALRERGVERVAVEPEARAFVPERLAEAFGRERVVSGIGVVRALRGRKEPRELELLRGATELTQAAIRAVAERLRPGLTDREIGRWIGRAQERLGLRGTWVLPLLGETAAYPHGEPEGRRLERGAGVLVDTGGSLHGYQSDTTRTWVFDGPAQGEFARAWNTVREAQRRAFDALGPGRPAAGVDRAARAVIEGAGYGSGYTAFSHRLGHGIGLQGHEEPYLDGGNELLLEPGMTFSDEPGIYLAGRFGVRLEDIVVVTADGADHFGTWQEAPETP